MKKQISLSQIFCSIGLSCEKQGFHSAVSGVSIDSRKIKPGELFFSLPGDRVDGQSFLADAASKGAAFAVVEKNYAGQDFGLSLIRVEDRLEVLQTLAKKMLQSCKAKIIAVTGSVGKTTTKDFIIHLLQAKYRVVCSPGNYNSQIGLPLAILNHVHGDEDFLVLEMGMTAANQIANLVQIAPPDIALITNVALVHAESFNSLEEIAKAKLEIFSNPKTQLGIVPFSIAEMAKMTHTQCSKLSFECDNTSADYTAIDKTSFFAVLKNKIEVAALKELPVVGRHNRSNFLAAAAAVSLAGLSWEEITHRAESLTLPEMRLQMIEKNGILFVNDSYNSSPIAVEAALEALPKPKSSGKVIAILGSMMELGKFSADCHRKVGERALSVVDEMFCLGNETLPIYESWKQAKRSVFFSLERKEIVKQLALSVRTGDVVLIKGSNATGLSEFLDEELFGKKCNRGEGIK